VTASGYTGLNVDGLVSLQTGELANISLASNRTLTNDEAVNGVLIIAMGHATNAIVIPTNIATTLKGKLYIVVNTDAALAATVKVGSSTGVSVAATKTAIIRINSAGTDVARVTLDA
jgi:hypothetical protein